MSATNCIAFVAFVALAAWTVHCLTRGELDIQFKDDQPKDKQ